METIENPLVSPLRGNNNPEVATSIQNQQTLQQPVTYTSTPPNPGPKRNVSFKKLVFYFFGLILLVVVLFIGAILFSTRVLHRRPYIVIVPKTVPSGFTRAEAVQSERDENGRFFIFTYNNPSGEKFTYHLQLDAPESQGCSPPQAEPSFVSDYRVFSPKDSDDGCAMTLTNKDDKKTSVYKWHSGSSQYFIFADNLCISDQEALNIANSLKAQLIFIGGTIDPNTGREIN